MFDLNFTFLGSFAVEFNGEPIVRFRSDRVRALLAYLALEPNQAHQRPVLAALLWPEVTDKLALQNLRVALYYLRQSLDRAAPDLSRTVLAVTRQTICLDMEAEVTVQTYAIYFQTLLAACQAHSHDHLHGCSTCLARLRQAADRYRGELLAGFGLADAPGFEEWLLLRREMLHQQALLTFKDLADSYETLTDYDQAYTYARRLLNLDPYREASHRQLMRLLAYRDLPDQALAQFATCRQLLRDELGTEPEAETVTLAEQIQRGALRGPAALRQAQAPAKAQQSALAMATTTRERPTSRLDWGDVPQMGPFFGRTAELAQLQRWLVADRCRLITILGMGGLGKTSLAAQVATAVADDFDVVIWRSLLNAPLLDDLLPGVLKILAGTAVSAYPTDLDQKLALLLHHLRQKRCLLVLDNLETILQSGLAGQYRSDYEDYGRLIETLAQHEHQSCLLLTGREQPQSRWLMRSNLPGVQTLALNGLDLEATHQILQAHGLTVSQTEAGRLADRYSGNPLALNLLAQTIQDFYFGDVEAFLTEETVIFADIRDVLDNQFNRLSPLEQDILLWLAVAREPMFPPDLTAALVQPVRQRELLETLRSLQQRSLLERSEAGVMLQNVVTEYLTDTLIEWVTREIESSDLKWLNSHALLQVKAKTYVRHSQTRLILQPIAQQLTARLGLTGVAQTCHHLLDHLRRESPLAPGYAAGNILNLLLQSGVDVTGYDFSQLSVWQADLQDQLLPEVNFSGADLSGAIFTDIFGPIYAVAFSPDGQLLAAGAADGRIRLWAVATAQPVALLEGHAEAVWGLAFSPDGHTLASAGAEGVIFLSDVGRRQLIRTLKGHQAGIHSVAFSPNGQTLASGSSDRTIRSWDVSNGQTQHILTGHTDNVQAVAFSPNGQFLASASRDQTARLWEVSTGQPLCTLNGHANWVNAVVFSPNGETLVSATEDGQVCLWDTSAVLLTSALNSKPYRTLTDHSSGIQSVAFTPDGKILASAGSDHTIRLWDVSTGQVSHILRGHLNWVRSVAFSPNGKTLASGSWDYTVQMWDIDQSEGQLLRTFQGYGNMVPAVAISPDGETLASAHIDRIARLWDIKTGQLRYTLRGHQNWVWHVAFSADGQTLASSSHDDTVRLWDTRTGQLRQILQGHQNGIQVVAFSPDTPAGTSEQLLASSGLDHAICLWDVRRGALKQTLKKHSNWVNSVAFSPDGQTLASGSADQSIILWDVATGQIRRILEGHNDGVQNITFSPDGTLLASISWDHTVRLWEVNSGRVRHTLLGHTNWGQSVAFSPDGQILASSSYDQTIRLWDVKTGQQRQILKGHTNWVFYVTFSSDGEILASSSADGTIKLWSPHTGQCLRTLQAPGPYAGMAISSVTGITEAQRSALKALGAVEDV